MSEFRRLLASQDLAACSSTPEADAPAATTTTEAASATAATVTCPSENPRKMTGTLVSQS